MRQLFWDKALVHEKRILPRKQQSGGYVLFCAGELHRKPSEADAFEAVFIACILSFVKCHCVAASTNLKCDGGSHLTGSQTHAMFPNHTNVFARSIAIVRGH